jgi:hypothetical protein
MVGEGGFFKLAWNNSQILNGGEGFGNSRWFGRFVDF